MTLTPQGYRPRLIDSRFDTYLNTFGAVYVRGPKGCGKTWASRNQASSEIQLNRDVLEAVRTDRAIALRGDAPHLIDEWQNVPALWDDVRFEVDRGTGKGRFILCGSFSVSKDEEEGKLHSGTGRIGRLDMRTMSLFESGDSDGSVSLKGLFDGGFESTDIKQVGLEELIRLSMRGGWPWLLDDGPDAGIALREYIRSVCESDSTELDGVRRDSRKMMALIKSLARNESTTASDTTIARDMSENDGERISEATLSDYKSALERLHLVWYQRSFDPNFRSPVRVAKKPKRHLADPSLAFSALGLTVDSAINDLKTFGFIFESMCERDLLIYAEANGGELMHYRESDNKEVDAVVELPDGRYGLFEIKLGMHEVDDAAENLLEMRSKFEEKGGRVPQVLCVVCGVCGAAYRRPDGVYVVPITRLTARYVPGSAEHFL